MLEKLIVPQTLGNSQQPSDDPHPEPDESIEPHKDKTGWRSMSVGMQTPCSLVGRCQRFG
jgi:hypothetical protein